MRESGGEKERESTYEGQDISGSLLGGLVTEHKGSQSSKTLSLNRISGNFIY